MTRRHVYFVALIASVAIAMFIGRSLGCRTLTCVDGDEYGHPGAICQDDDIGSVCRTPPPLGLRCELMRGPGEVEITTATPHFSWAIGGAGQSQRQTAYRILVGSTSQLTESNADRWDSGVVSSRASNGVEYAGKPLGPKQRYFWRVKVWDSGGEPSPYSEVQSFRLGDLSSTVPSRLPLTSQFVEPAKVVQTEQGHLFAEFPAAAYGTLVLDFQSQREATSFDVVIGEHRIGNAVWRPADGGFSPELSVVSYRGRLAWSGAPGEARLELPAVSSPAAAPLPNGLSGILPFRYAEVVGDPAALREVRVRQLAVSYPFEPDAGWFSSSDPVLNDVWVLAKYSMKATSAFGVYVDGNRERIPYEADAFINQLGHYGVDADYSLARFTVAYFLDHATWPTEWIMHTVFLAWFDYLYTGDDSLVRAHFDQLTQKTLAALARDDGLISTQTGLITSDVLRAIALRGQNLQDIVDWPEVERDGYDMVAINTVVNMFHFRALELMGALADVVGRSGEAESFRARSRLVRQSILAKLFDPQLGLFVDGEGSRHVSLHANMFALAFGLAPADRVAGIVAFVQHKGMACSVYGAQYLLEGLYKHRKDTYALSLLTSRSRRSWAHMIYDLGATIAHEAWDPEFKPNEDWNHAWGAAPANIIPRWLMGIQPLAPGFETFTVAPQIGDLEWAEMQLPTIRGPIFVRVERKKEGPASIDLEVPPNADALVQPPCRSQGANVWVDGDPTSVSTKGEPAFVGPLGPGHHRVECL